MRKFVFTIAQEDIGKSVRTYLRQHQHFSRRLTNRLKEHPDSFLYNNMQVQSTYRMLVEGILEINIPEDVKQSATAENIPLLVVFEDEDILVVDKPPYMPVHPSHEHQQDTLANAVAKHAEQMCECFTFRAVNRLDRNTSGLVVLAKNAYAASRIGGNIHKRYWAVVWGEIKEAGTVTSPIRLKPDSKIVRETATDGDSAVTHYKPRAVGNGLTLLELELETGRTHQIRVHMSSIGHPLVGDDLYGGANIGGIDRQALHCYSVRFIHPYTKDEINLQSEIPEDMQSVINRINNDIRSIKRMERIASFEVNHLNLEKGIYISRVDDDIVTYDIRVRKPNTTFLDTGTIHTIEHLVATFVRNSNQKEKIIYFGPMGCRTGFYLLVRNMKQEDVIKLIYDAFSFVVAFVGEIPGTTQIECGNYLDHNMKGAKEESMEFLKVIENYNTNQLLYTHQN